MRFENIKNSSLLIWGFVS